MLPYKTLVRPYYNTVQFSRIPPPYWLLPLLNLSNILPLKSWTSTYSALLSNLNLNTSQHRRKTAKILTNFKLKFHHNLVRSPLVLSPPPIYLTRHYSSLNYSPIFCKTSAFFHSLYPSAIHLWNSLPEHIKSSTSISFIKFKLHSVSF